MHVELKKGVFLVSDENQYYIQKEWISHKKDADGNVKEVPNTKKLSGFHRELDTLFDSYFDRSVCGSDAETVEALVKEMRKTRNEIRKWLKELRGTDK